MDAPSGNTISCAEPAKHKLLFAMAALGAGLCLGGVFLGQEIAIQSLLEEKLLATLCLVLFAALLGCTFFFFQNLTAQLRLARQKMDELATMDALTGLCHRRFLLERFEIELSRQQRCEGHLGFVTLDLDHFKKVNDHLGHPKADQVLKSVAAVLKNRVRPYDIVGRYGGESFAVVLPGTDPLMTHIVAERLRLAIELDASIRGQVGKLGHLTASFGVASFVKGDNMNSLMFRSNEALCHAKQNGRNRVELDAPLPCSA